MAAVTVTLIRTATHHFFSFDGMKAFGVTGPSIWFLLPQRDAPDLIVLLRTDLQSLTRRRARRADAGGEKLTETLRCIPLGLFPGWAASSLHSFLFCRRIASAIGAHTQLDHRVYRKLEMRDELKYEKGERRPQDPGDRLGGDGEGDCCNWTSSLKRWACPISRLRSSPNRACISAPSRSCHQPHA